MTSTTEDLLSTQQRAAVIDSGSRVLVSAGAGSGKTRLLVEYFVRALTEEGAAPEQLIAVTFTRKAAAELTTRIRSSLERLGRLDLARSIDAATIGTIHGLCRRLIKEQALEAGVDPVCAVLEADAALLIKEEASRIAWQFVIEHADDSELEVLASRGDGFRKQMIALYERLRGLGSEMPQVEAAGPAADEDPRTELASVARAALAAGAAARPTPTLRADLGRLQELLGWIERENGTFDSESALDKSRQFFPSRKTQSMEPYFLPIREALTRYRSALAGRQLAPLVRTMNDLLAEFHGEYEGRKRDASLLDFADLELRARRLIATTSGSAPSVCALPGSRVLVDEFQDTNELQCSILEGLGASRLLMVGDERQSIYRFRGADVEVFRRREESLGSQDGAPNVGAIHRLDVNYRSRPEILDFVNRLFSHANFFGERFVPLEPGRTRTQPGTKPASGPSEDTHRPAGFGQPTVEVLVVGRRTMDPDKTALAIQEAEAEAIAGRIRRLIDDEGRAQRDIVVLLPAQTSVQTYRQALLARGVDVYLVRGKGYYSQEEVADVTSLLRLLVNPHDDIALISALRSPLVGLSDDALYLLGRDGGRGRVSLWQAIREGRTRSLRPRDRALLDCFVTRLNNLRSRVGRPGLARLIDEAITECDYDLCLLASQEGKRRFANVRKLMRLADDFEAFQGPDLAAFVGLLLSIGDLSDTEGSAPTLAEGEDVVRVMTVHQAKGLEFPVVVLAGLGSDLRRSNPPEFIVGDDGRMGVFLKGSKHATYEDEDLGWGPAAQILADDRRKDSEEDVRLLYVAMTRAQERLILVGASPSGKMQRCRIGRIVEGLGLDVLPPEGQSVTVDGLDATIACIAPPPSENAPPMDPAASGQRGGRTYSPPPEFLDIRGCNLEPRQISFSALAAYQRCARRFYLERVLGLPEEPGPNRYPPEAADYDEAPAAREERMLDTEEAACGREVGLLVHWLIERAAGARVAPAEQLLRQAAREWFDLTGVALGAPALDRAIALTTAFWDSPCAVVHASSTVLREAPFFFEQDGTAVSGVMDLIDRAGDLWRIVDYKTNALNGRTPEEAAGAYALQASVYCLAALRAGAHRVQMEFVFLEKPAEPVSVRRSRADLPTLEADLDAALGGLKRGEFQASQGPECEHCGVAAVCEAVAR